MGVAYGPYIRITRVCYRAFRGCCCGAPATALSNYCGGNYSG